MRSDEPQLVIRCGYNLWGKGVIPAKPAPSISREQDTLGQAIWCSGSRDTEGSLQSSDKGILIRWVRGRVLRQRRYGSEPSCLRISYLMGRGKKGLRSRLRVLVHALSLPRYTPTTKIAPCYPLHQIYKRFIICRLYSDCSIST